MNKFNKYKRKQKIKEKQPRPFFKVNELIINIPYAPEHLKCQKRKV